MSALYIKNFLLNNVIDFIFFLFSNVGFCASLVLFLVYIYIDFKKGEIAKITAPRGSTN